MRTAPIGLVRSLSPEQCLALGARAAAITHGHPSGYWTAGAIAAIVRLICEGVETGEAVRQVIAMLQHRARSEETVAALRRALDPRIATIDELGEGWVGEEALAMGVHAVLRGGSLKEVLMIAVNHDGDSDSTGSIAGQIWGAREGVAHMPVDWVSVLDVLAPLNHVASRLIAVA
jgi:ADP-ribosylglycohydrolase